MRLQGEEILLLALGVLALAWFCASVYVLVSRWFHDLGTAAIARERSAVVPRWLPPRVLAQVAADTATSDEVARELSRQFLARYRDRARAQAARAGSRWDQIVALRVLARARSPEAWEHLVAALESGDDAIVEAAVAMLGDLGDLASAVALVAALRAGHLNRSRIAAQLDRSPAASVDLLLPLRHDPTPAVRFWGATLLARHAGDPRVAGELIAATGDEDDSVRAAAAEALAATRTRASERAVRALLADPAWFVRVHAVRTLQSYGRDAPLADVVPLLSDRSWWVRAAAKEALEARPRRATVLLRGQLEAPDRFARNGAAEVFQNTGVLDELLDAAPTNPAKRRLVERVLRAGGPGLAAAAAARQAADRGDREDLAVSA